MNLSISIEKPDWDPNPQKSTTDNHDWRRCVIVKFENQTFKWIPTYMQIADILNALKECEQVNKDYLRDK